MDATRPQEDADPLLGTIPNLEPARLHGFPMLPDEGELRRASRRKGERRAGESDGIVRCTHDQQINIL